MKSRIQKLEEQDKRGPNVSLTPGRAYRDASHKITDATQKAESRSQEPEKKKIRRMWSPPYHSGF
jgi:hypothetical protein